MEARSTRREIRGEERVTSPLDALWPEEPTAPGDATRSELRADGTARDFEAVPVATAVG